MSKEEIFEEWKNSLGYDFSAMLDYMDTMQSYIDFAEYYHKEIQGDKKITITLEILLDMIHFIAESTTDINEQFGGCTNLEKLIENNEMPELYYKLVDLKVKEEIKKL
jgi:hypothetical protein